LEKKASSKTKLNFETALNALEEIARRLEDGSLGLEESITEFEKGIRLARFCHQKLEEAERNIEILQKGEDGQVEKRNVKVKPDTGEIEDDDDLQGSLL
jgi:exodeoxyribonuclease VII small subunit